MGKEKKKIFEIILDVFAWLSLILALLIAVATIFASFSGDNGKEVFGVRMFIVQSDSMSAPEGQVEDVYFNAGDLIFVKKAEDSTNLKEGQVITFVSYNPDSYGKIITHRIREVRVSPSGKTIGYVTYGIRTGVNDQSVVSPETVIGVYEGKLAGVGNIFTFLKTPQGFALSVMIPSVLIIIYFSISIGRALGKKGEEEERVNYKDDLNELKEKLGSIESKIEGLLTLLTTQRAQVPVQGAVVQGAVEQPQSVEQPQNPVGDETVATETQGLNVRKIPFALKLLSLDASVQQMFANVHNQLISYKKVSARISFKCISYRLGRVLLAKITVRGKTIKLHFALDVEKYNKNVYFQKDTSSVKAYEQVPFAVKLKSARGEKNAIKLIEDLMANNGAIKNQKFEKVDILSLLREQTALQENDAEEPTITQEADQEAQEEASENTSPFGKGGKKIPFIEKLSNLEQNIKDNFIAVHNALAQYKKVSARTSFRCVSYRLGRVLLAKMTVRGKTLKLHLALDVEKFNKNVYFQNDLSSVKAYEQVPFTVKVKSARGVKNALVLIESLMTQNNAVINGKYAQIDNIEQLEK